MRRLSFVLLAIVVLLVALPLFAQSQATTGVIEGTVVDASGAAIPGVTVTIRNTATGYEVVVVTDAAGHFRAVLLPVGPYRLSPRSGAIYVAHSVSCGVVIGPISSRGVAISRTSRMMMVCDKRYMWK